MRRGPCGTNGISAHSSEMEEKDWWLASSFQHYRLKCTHESNGAKLNNAAMPEWKHKGCTDFSIFMHESQEEPQNAWGAALL